MIEVNPSCLWRWPLEGERRSRPGVQQDRAETQRLGPAEARRRGDDGAGETANGAVSDPEERGPRARGAGQARTRPQRKPLAWARAAPTCRSGPTRAARRGTQHPPSGVRFRDRRRKARKEWLRPQHWRRRAATRGLGDKAKTGEGADQPEARRPVRRGSGGTGQTALKRSDEGAQVLTVAQQRGGHGRRVRSGGRLNPSSACHTGREGAPALA